MNTNRIKLGVISAALAVTGVLAGASQAKAATHFSVGIGIGPSYGYSAPAVAYRPPYPGPGYTWIDGYYDPYGTWIAGYWSAPRAYVEPRAYVGGYYGNSYGGYRRDYDHDDHRRYDRDDHRGHDRDDFRGRGNAWGRR